MRLGGSGRLAFPDTFKEATMGLHRMPGALGRMFPRGKEAAPELSPPIPANWRELPWQERRSLAAAHSDTPVVSGDDAERAILAALGNEGSDQ